MTSNIRKMYKAAIKDDEFNEEMVKISSNNERPGFFSSEIHKKVYATCYYGWRAGKGNPYED